MATLFLSDVHLDVTPEGRPRRAEFVAFLRAVDPARVDGIVLLGDLFDFWFEYKHVIFSGYFDVLRAIAALRDQGVAFHLVCGNHDFWAGRFLEQDLGITVHRTPAVMEFGGRRALVLHGDGLNPDDWAYRIYKRIARAPIVVAAFRWLHPDWAMALAQRISRSSRRLLQPPDASAGPEALALRAYAQQVLARGEADVIICGHAHCPVFETFPTPTGGGLYLNAGDWMHHRSYIEWDGSDFHLRDARAGESSAAVFPVAEPDRPVSPEEETSSP